MAVVALLKIITKEFFYGNAGAFERIVFFAAGPRRHNKIAQEENLAEIFPRADLAKRVKPNNKVQRIALLQIFRETSNGIDGVRHTGTGELNGRHRKAQVSCHR